MYPEYSVCDPRPAWTLGRREPGEKLRDMALQIYEITLRRERRARLRFPVNIELRYQTRVRADAQPIRGTGLTYNMSSKALAFRADRTLEPGTQISVSMGWP